MNNNPDLDLIIPSIALVRRNESPLKGWDSWNQGDGFKTLMEFKWPSENWMTLVSSLALFLEKDWAYSWWNDWFVRQRVKGLWGKECMSCVYGTWIHIPALMAAYKINSLESRRWARASWAYLHLSSAWYHSKNIYDNTSWYPPWLCVGKRSFARRGDDRKGDPHHIDYHAMSAFLAKSVGEPTIAFDSWSTSDAEWGRLMFLEEIQFGINDPISQSILKGVRRNNLSDIIRLAGFLDGYKVQEMSFRILRFKNGVVHYCPTTPNVGKYGTDNLQAHWSCRENKQDREILFMGNGDRSGDVSSITTFDHGSRKISSRTLSSNGKLKEKTIDHLGDLLVEIVLDPNGVILTPNVKNNEDEKDVEKDMHENIEEKKFFDSVILDKMNIVLEKESLGLNISLDVSKLVNRLIGDDNSDLGLLIPIVSSRLAEFLHERLKEM